MAAAVPDATTRMLLVALMFSAFRKLVKAGATVRAYDPAGMEEAKKMLTGVTFCERAYDALTGADAATILTEWNEFRSLDLDRVKQLMTRPVIVDLRNLYDPDQMADAGIDYRCVGRRPKNGAAKS